MSTMSTRSQIGAAQRWVIKIGSSLLTNNGRGLDMQAIQAWVEQMAELHQQGRELVLVSSGAVAAGMSRLGWTRRPNELVALQAAAAVFAAGSGAGEVGGVDPPGAPGPRCRRPGSVRPRAQGRIPAP